MSESEPKQDTSKSAGRSRSGSKGSSSKKRRSSSSSSYSSKPSAISWPLRKIRYLINYWSPGKTTQKSLGRLGEISKNIMHFEGTRQTFRRDDGELLIRNWPSNTTMLNPLWWFAWLGQFLFRWLITRPVWPMALALPALLTISVLVAGLSRGARMSSSAEVARFKQLYNSVAGTDESGQLSIREEDLAKARLAADALIRLDSEKTGHLYVRATIEQAAGDSQAADTMMTDLAVSRKMYGAALWKAEQVGDLSIFETWTDAQRAEYLKWLDQASKNDPSQPAPRQMKGEVYRAIGDYRNAYRELRPIAEGNPDIDFAVAYLEKQLGFTKQAQARAERLGRYYRDVVADKPEDLESRVRYASMLVLLEREPQAVTTLEDGLKLAQTDQEVQRLRTALADTMVLQSSKLASSEDDSTTALLNRFRLLRQALNYDSNNVNLLNAIIDVCVQAGDSQNNDLVVLRKSLVQGVDPDTAHFIIGTIALNKGDTKTAQHHLELAVKSNPQLPGMLNNLAYLITKEEKPDLERALRLSNAALTTLPFHPALRETRGQIYLLMQRYTDAISDLEFALSQKNSPQFSSQVAQFLPDVRKGLVAAYSAIGQQEIADEQLQLLESESTQQAE